MEREGQLDVKNVTRNALKKNNSALVEGVLPFDMEKLQPFDMGYLSGFQAGEAGHGERVPDPGGGAGGKTVYGGAAES